jgi:uncharacterized membrane-anchored protein
MRASCSSRRGADVLYTGIAKLDRRTKDLAKRLGPGDVAFVDHCDMDRVSAESIVETGCEVVVNSAQFVSGAYPNVGPLVLALAGIRLVDNAGEAVFEEITEGQQVAVDRGDIMVDGRVVASGRRLTPEDVEEAIEAAKAGLGDRLDEFARNTLEYLDKEKGLLTDGIGVPEVRTRIHGRPALVVVRGYDYKEDLRTLGGYVRDQRPVLIGIDGGADALIDRGFTPEIIIGDMDSVSDEALRSGAELIVHAYPDGRAPGMERIERLGLKAIAWPIAAMSEDLGLLLAYEAGADLIVAVGTHNNLVEQLDKGRKGMSSTFLIRLKVGPRLVDAKGVSKLYRGGPSSGQLTLLALAGVFTAAVVIIISPGVRSLVELSLLKLLVAVRTGFGL